MIHSFIRILNRLQAESLPTAGFYIYLGSAARKKARLRRIEGDELGARGVREGQLKGAHQQRLSFPVAAAPAPACPAPHTSSL